MNTAQHNPDGLSLTPRQVRQALRVGQSFLASTLEGQTQQTRRVSAVFFVPLMGTVSSSGARGDGQEIPPAQQRTGRGGWPFLEPRETFQRQN
jgi:hypothetical protein